jgi:hypothetical protein
VTGSCIDILSDAWAWLCAIGASAAVAVVAYQGDAESTETSKWIYIGATFAGYLCAIFVAGFAVAAFLWVGTRSKMAMRVGFTFVAAVVATAPLALNKIKSPQPSEAAPAPAAQAAPDPAQQATAQETGAQAPAVEQSAQPVVEAEPEFVPPSTPEPPALKSHVQIEPARRTTTSARSSGTRAGGARTSRRSSATSGGSRGSSAPRAFPSPSAADLKMISAEMRTLLADIRTDAAELQERLRGQGLDTILAPTSFAGRTQILNARRRLTAIKRITDDYERTVKSRLEEFPDRIYELNVSDELKDAAVDAFQARQGDVLRRLREIAQLHRSILAEADRLFVFMDGRIGRYKVTDRILFQNAADAETYTTHIERLQALGAKEERAVVENQRAALNRIASMERELVEGGR